MGECGRRGWPGCRVRGMMAGASGRGSACGGCRKRTGRRGEGRIRQLCRRPPRSCDVRRGEGWPGSSPTRPRCVLLATHPTIPVPGRLPPASRASPRAHIPCWGRAMLRRRLAARDALRSAGCAAEDELPLGEVRTGCWAQCGASWCVLWDGHRAGAVAGSRQDGVERAGPGVSARDLCVRVRAAVGNVVP